MDPIEERQHAGNFCWWPRGENAPKVRDTKQRRGGDTMAVNVGRRRNPTCKDEHCHRRVDAPGDELCRICVKRDPAKG